MLVVNRVSDEARARVTAVRPTAEIGPSTVTP